jgi:hypothetical protein
MAAFSIYTPPDQIDKTRLAPGGFGTTLGVTIPSMVLGSFADTATNAGRTYFCEVNVQWPVTITGVMYWGGSVSSGNIQTALYNAAGSRLALSASVAQVGNTIKSRVPFSAPIAIPQGTYFAAIGTTATGKLYMATGVGVCTYVEGTAGVPPTTFTVADSGAGLLFAMPYLALY